MRASVTVLLVAMVLLAGCVEEEAVVEPVAFADFDLVDGLTNGSVSKEAQLGEAWVAYFSASWCGHCHPTLDVLDEVIPNGSLLIFNKDPREQHSDMVAWNDDMEEALERDLSRPFIHAPDLSTEMNVSGIPYVVFVDAEGHVTGDRLGLWTNAEEMRLMWNQTLAA